MAEEIDLSQVAQTAKEYARIVRGQATNEVIAGYYKDIAAVAEMERDYDTANKLKNKGANLRSCHRIMFYNHYEKSAVKDFKHTIYCHDRWCPLCAKLIAATRMQKFEQILQVLESEYDFYHMIMTLPNVRGTIPPWKSRPDLPELTPTVRQFMPKAFKMFTRYLTGNAKIAGLDFSDLGYGGMVRSLEITFRQNQEYHPHYHSIVAMRKGLEFGGKHKNDFSYNKYTGKVTLYSNFEILLQKIWYLVLNGERVTAKAIARLKQGYSCQFKRILPAESHEVFKYIVKPEKDQYMTPEVFQDLSHALKGIHAVQTYGCFRGWHLEDEQIDDSDNPLYNSIIEALNRFERPVECGETPSTVRDNILAQKYVYISRRSIRSFLRRMGADDEEYLLADPAKLEEFVQTVMPGVLDRPASSFLYLDGGRSVKPKQDW